MGQSYRDLIVWQRAVQMSVAIYQLTSAFPRDELYGLTSQLRRAGVQSQVTSQRAMAAGRPGNTSSSSAWLAGPTWKYKRNSRYQKN